MLFLLLSWRAGWELMVKEGRAQDPSLNPVIHRAVGDQSLLLPQILFRGAGSDRTGKGVALH